MRAAWKSFRQFGGESAPNASNVARHRYIDDYIREQLPSDSRLQIVLLGCGFDSRAFRLQGGSWFELDEPQLIAYKNQRLSARESPNPLQRIPIDFTSDTLREKLQPLDVSTAGSGSHRGRDHVSERRIFAPHAAAAASRFSRNTVSSPT